MSASLKLVESSLFFLPGGALKTDSAYSKSWDEGTLKKCPYMAGVPSSQVHFNVKVQFGLSSQVLLHSVHENKFYCIEVSPEEWFQCIEVSPEDRFYCIEASPEDRFIA